MVRNNAVRALSKLRDPGEKALLHLLSSNDRYTRDTARTELEQQGVLEHYCMELQSGDLRKIHNAIKFLEILADKGESQLAKAIMENHQRTIANKILSSVKPAKTRPYINNPAPALKKMGFNGKRIVKEFHANLYPLEPKQSSK